MILEPTVKVRPGAHPIDAYSSPDKENEKILELN